MKKKLVLRSYQEKCLDNCISWIKQSVEPAVVEATVSFGKSIVIAELARRIVEMSGKKVLILCPTGKLVKQNTSKVRELGLPCSVFSASLNQKSIRHNIVVGTPKSISNSVSRFGKEFATILIDEGEGLTNAVIEICNKIKKDNPLVRILGFTGTPWRTGTGFVYRIDIDGNTLSEKYTENPFYLKCIHRTTTQELMDEGWLTPMVIGEILPEKYHTAEMKPNKSGKFNNADLDRAYHGQGRITSAIVADIVRQSQNKNGVMIFGATIQHCKEIMESLPPELSGMVYSGNPDNDMVMSAFESQRIKYIVNQDMLTIGVDFPHVDVIAILRKTTSSRLLQQILGRGVRLHLDNWIGPPETVEERLEAIRNGPKPECLYLDYTEDNLETHFPDGYLWAPIVEARAKGTEGSFISCECPDCGVQNSFSARKNDAGYGVDREGYFLDLEGNQILTEYGPIPAHHGRRCVGVVKVGGGRYEQCSYRYTFKECVHCAAENDIAAKYCFECKGELVNPGDKLRAEFRALKRSPFNRQCDLVEECTYGPTKTRTGRKATVVNIKTPYRSMTFWVMDEPSNNFEIAMFNKWKGLNGQSPRTIEYVKSQKTQMYHCYSFNQPTDEERMNEAASSKKAA